MRIFFQNPTKGPLITVSFDANDDASLAFVPAAVDCGAKYGTAAVGGAAGAPVVATAAIVGALVSGDSSVRVPAPVLPNPRKGINRFAPRASVDAIEDGPTIERAMRSTDAVGLPGEGTPTTAADVSPLAGLAARLKDWDGATPLEIAGFKFEKVADADGKPTIKITISTDNVQDIIDASRAIQEAFPDDTRPIITEFTHPNLRHNLLMWNYHYFDEFRIAFLSQRNKILTISEKLTRGESLAAEDNIQLQELESTSIAMYRKRIDELGRDVNVLAYLLLRSSFKQQWQGLDHDMFRRHDLIMPFEVVIQTLKDGGPLGAEEMLFLSYIDNSDLGCAIRSAIFLAKYDVKQFQCKIKIAAHTEFIFANNNDHEALIDILANLISNAARYSDPKKERREIHITARRTDNGIEIEVRDNGIGIPADKLSEIGQFEFRVGEKNVDGSHGHGLWQTQQNLRDLGWGKLQVDSTHGEGSSFRFTIPIHVN